MEEVDEKKFQEEVNRGSVWRKWDLHLHTASSYDYKYKGPDADDILISKLREHEISAVAITDHFLIDKNRICNLKKLAPEIQFFPGVELRTDKGSSNIHVILIFSNEIDLNNLCSDFDYFKRHNSTASESDDTIFWDYKEIVKFAKKRNAIISVHAGSKSSGLDDKISNSLPHNQAIKRDYSDTVDIFEMGKEKDCEGYKTHVFPVIGEKPLIISSDNHDARNYDDSKCLWIKADLTFEGLKQILYEPRERISLGHNNPDSKLKYMVIDYVELYGEKIYLNNGLNSIIGGRSTGKSTLLNSIAKFQKNSNVNTDKQNIFEEGSYRVIWADGEEDESREVEFIPQEYMISLSSDRDKLNKLIEKIIRKKQMDSAEVNYRNKIADISKQIHVGLTDYFSIVDELSSLMVPEGSLEAAKKNIERLTWEIEEIRLFNQFTQDENITFNGICNELNQLKDEDRVLEIEEEQLNVIKNTNIFLKPDFSMLTKQNRIELEIEYSNLQEEVRKSWEGIIDKKIIDISARRNQIADQISHKINSNIYKKGKELEMTNSKIAFLEMELSKHKQIERDIRNYQEVLEYKTSVREAKYELLVDKFMEYVQAIQDFCSQFSIEQDDLSINVSPMHISLEEKIKYLNLKKTINTDFINEFNQVMRSMDFNKIKDRILNKFRNIQFSFNQNKNLEDLIKDIFSNNWFDFNYMITYQNDEFGKMSQGKKSFVVLKLLLEFSEDEKPVLIDQPEDSLDNRAIYHELRKYLIDTKKKRQIIVVTHNPNVVIGSDSENVIVAHQESEDEPNKNNQRFEYLNGSIENTQSKIDSCEFVLESQGIREHIFDVLEGGEEAFKKREQKYNQNKE